MNVGDNTKFKISWFKRQSLTFMILKHRFNSFRDRFLPIQQRGGYYSTPLLLGGEGWLLLHPSDSCVIIYFNVVNNYISPMRGVVNTHL